MVTFLLLLLRPVTLTGVVDRIEGEYAVVEWQVPGAAGAPPTLQYTDLPLAALPCPVAEGNHLQARTRPTAAGHLPTDFASATVFHPQPPLRATTSCSAWTRHPRALRGGRSHPRTKEGARKP